MTAEHRVEYLRLGEIEPAEANPKRHDGAAIARSIDRFGLAELPTVDGRTGRLVAGHGRFEDLCARRGAGEEPPAGVRVADDGEWLVPVLCGWSSANDDDAAAYLVASNRTTELGGWDDAQLAALLGDLADQDAALLAATGYNDTQLAALLDGPPPGEQGPAGTGAAADRGSMTRTELPDAGPPENTGSGSSGTPKAAPRSKLGDMFALGDHRVLCGDASNPETVDALLAALPDTPGIVHTDPPYGISAVGKDRKVGGGGTVTNRPGNWNISASDYAPIAGDDTTEAAADAYRLLSALLPEAVQVWWGANHYAGSAGLPDSPCWLFWDKQTNGDFADGEIAWTNHTGAVRRLVHLWNGLARASEKDQRRQHPTQKPVALAEWAMGVVDRRAERRVVLDVFAGAGCTLLAAERTGRTCGALELSPAYVDVICRRWQQMTGRKPELITEDGGRVPVDFTEDRGAE